MKDASNTGHQLHWLRHVLQGIGIAAIFFFIWAALHDDINWRVASAAIILIGAVLLASVILDIQSTRQERKDREVDEQVMPLADTLLANIPDPLILIDRRMVVFETNAAARQLLPTLRKGFPLSFSLRNPDVLGGIDQVLRTGKPVDIEHMEKLPVERAFELQISLLRGNEQWVLLFFRDLTSARRLEKMRVDFIANISHELRTPLASVIGFIETIQGPAANDKESREKFLSVMLAQARRMARLIDDLLSLSRVELHVHVQPQTPLELDSIVKQIVPALTPLAKENGVEINVEIGEGPFVINGDRDEMLRVAENLIENAVKYGNDGEKIEVRLKTLPEEEGQAAMVEFTVRDHGVGIAPEHLPRLTERFYRLDTNPNRRKGGTGLGLAIVKHIVIRHKGTLQIESKPNQGALFRVRIPARKETSDSASVKNINM